MFPRFWLISVAAALLAGGVGCKKSEPQSAEQAAPVAEQAAAPAEVTPLAPEQTAPPPQITPAPPPQKAQPVQVASALPGSADVAAALARKDYAGAVAALSRVKAVVAADQRVEYNNLMRTVMTAIYDAKETDPSAKRAYEAMKRIEAGR